MEFKKYNYNNMKTFICLLCDKINNYDKDFNQWSHRDTLFCSNCGSSVRERALYTSLIINTTNLKEKKIHEFSPLISSHFFKVLSSNYNYSYSKYLPNVDNGSLIKDNCLCMDIENIPLEDNSIDIAITMDIFEHLYNPDKAIKELYRILKDGGMYIFTVPIDMGFNSTKKLELNSDKTKYLQDYKPAIYKGIKDRNVEIHGNPDIPSEGSLVTHYWGYDIVDYIKKYTNFEVEIFNNNNIEKFGLTGIHNEVFICKKNNNIHTNISEFKKIFYNGQEESWKKFIDQEECWKNFINFNYIIPLGEECYTSQSIDKKFNIDLRKVSLPFDYVGGTMINRICSILISIYNNTFSITPEDYFFRKSVYDGKEVLCDKFGFEHYHIDYIKYDDDTTTESDRTSYYINKMIERWEKFISILKNNNNNILFYTVSHFNYAYNNGKRWDSNKYILLPTLPKNTDIVIKQIKEGEHFVYDGRVNILFELQNILEKFNPKNKILAVNYCNQDFKFKNINHKYLSVNVSENKKNDKNIFINNLYSFVKSYFIDYNKQCFMYKRKLFIHIGCGKCATTTIQYILNKLDCDNIYVPKTSHWSLLNENGWKLLHEEIKNIDTNCIVSCEGLIYTYCENRGEYLKTIKEEFNNFDIEIIYTVRNLKEYLISTYLQHIKTLNKCVFTDDFHTWVEKNRSGYLFNNLIKNFEDVFGIDKINVIVYSKDTVQDFFNLLNVDITNIEINSYYNKTTINLYHAFYIFEHINSLNEEIKLSLMEKYYKTMHKEISKVKEGIFPCAFDLCDLVKPIITNEDYNEWLIRNNYDKTFHEHILQCREDTEKLCLKYNLNLSLLV